jgi:hypothetical protein
MSLQSDLTNSSWALLTWKLWLEMKTVKIFFRFKYPEKVDLLKDFLKDQSTNKELLIISLGILYLKW